MPHITRRRYWDALDTTRKSLLIVGLTIMSPILLVLLLAAGSREAFDFITKVKI